MDDERNKLIDFNFFRYAEICGDVHDEPVVY